MKPLIALIALTALLGCTATQIRPTATRYATAPVLLPSDPSTVALLPSRPEHYVALGEVRVDVEGVRYADQIIDDPAITAAIRDYAARLGADAAMEIYIVGRETTSRDALLGRPVHHVRATAIRVGR